MTFWRREESHPLKVLCPYNSLRHHHPLRISQMYGEIQSKDWEPAVREEYIWNLTYSLVNIILRNMNWVMACHQVDPWLHQKKCVCYSPTMQCLVSRQLIIPMRQWWIKRRMKSYNPLIFSRYNTIPKINIEESHLYLVSTETHAHI